jgi:hypothetical protein
MTDPFDFASEEEEEEDDADREVESKRDFVVPAETPPDVQEPTSVIDDVVYMWSPELMRYCDLLPKNPGRSSATHELGIFRLFPPSSPSP